MKMTKVLVLGATGMLGHSVARVFKDDPSMQLVQTSRTKLEGYLKFEAMKDDVAEFINGVNPDWIINCIGVIKPHIDEKSPESILRAIEINGIFPYLLAKSTDKSIIQIATDCVYSGEKGNYKESDLHDATDVYGKTKSLGEIEMSNLIHLRVSIIGPEVGRSTSLLEWFKNQPEGAELNGFTDHLWNGITTHHFGRISHGIVSNNFIDLGKTHVVPKDIVTKARLLKIFSEAYNRTDVTISEVKSAKTIDRTLSTSDANLNTKIWNMAGFESIPTIREMVIEQAGLAN
jgi:dTDP-4-dehydrorhamnose reductase